LEAAPGQALYKPLVIGFGAIPCLLSVYLAPSQGFFRHHDALLRLGPVCQVNCVYGLLEKIIISSIDVAS